VNGNLFSSSNLGKKKHHETPYFECCIFCSLIFAFKLSLLLIGKTYVKLFDIGIPPIRRNTIF